MLFKNVSMKSIVLYQKGQVSPRMFDPGEVADGNLYPTAKDSPAFAPFTPPQQQIKPTPQMREEQKKDDIQAVASAYQNLVVHMSKMKSDMTMMINRIQELEDQVELLKVPADVDALYKTDPLKEEDVFEMQEDDKPVLTEVKGKVPLPDNMELPVVETPMRIPNEEEVEIEAPEKKAPAKKTTTRRKTK